MITSWTDEDTWDLRQALELLRQRYGANTILTDTGSILSNLLIGEGLVDTISLLVHPVIVGKGAYLIIGHMDRRVNLTLVKTESLEGGLAWMVYTLPT
jgi:Pyrimidine reductase, riboflavin biosynthesis